MAFSFHINCTPYITLKLVDNVSFVTNKIGRFCGHCKEGFGVDANMQGLFRPLLIQIPLIRTLSNLLNYDIHLLRHHIIVDREE